MYYYLLLLFVDVEKIVSFVCSFFSFLLMVVFFLGFEPFEGYRGEEGNKASLLRYSYTAVWVHSLTVQLILQKVRVMMGCACDDCYMGKIKITRPRGGLLMLMINCAPA